MLPTAYCNAALPPNDIQVVLQSVRQEVNGPVTQAWYRICTPVLKHIDKFGHWWAKRGAALL